MVENDEKQFDSMSLGDHLDELRTRLILSIVGIVVGMIVCLFFGKYLMTILTSPYERAVLALDLTPMLQTIQPAEGFLVYIKICLIFGLLLVSPWVFYQGWAFISTGLYKKERRYAHAVAPASAILFVGGVTFFMFIIAPLAMKFFVNFNMKMNAASSLTISSNWTLQSYINMILMMSLVFGLGFQMPIAIIFAERMKLVTVKQLAAVRKYVLLGLVVVSAIATPPDVISQVSLAVPLYILYEGSIVICRILRRRKTK